MIDLSHMLVYSIITDCPTNCLKCGTDLKCEAGRCKAGTFLKNDGTCEGEYQYKQTLCIQVTSAHQFILQCAVQRIELN